MGTDFLVGPFAITPLGTRGNGFKLKESRFRLHLRRTPFTMRVVEHWHKLPREVDTPSLEPFKARLDKVVSNLIQLNISLLIAGRVALEGWKVLPNPNYSMIV